MVQTFILYAAAAAVCSAGAGCPRTEEANNAGIKISGVLYWGFVLVSKRWCVPLLCAGRAKAAVWQPSPARPGVQVLVAPHRIRRSDATRGVGTRLSCVHTKYSAGASGVA